MYVKKFYAKSMPEAMKAIRAEMGKDAVILHSEKKRQPGFWGFFRAARLEVTAAIDKDLRDFPTPTQAASDDVRKMRRELADLKFTMTQVSRNQEAQVAAKQIRQQPGEYTLPPRVTSLDNWYKRLLEQGVVVELAQQIIQSVADELSRWALDNENVLNEHLHWHLSKQLQPETRSNSSSGAPKVRFVVGPTGVGKTTTIAKLAANFKQQQSGKVIMITTDTFRVAAIPQIKAFGDLLNIPTAVAYNPQELSNIINRYADYDLILIDTPGKNQRDEVEVNQVGEFLSAVPEKTVYLAISAGTAFHNMQQIVNAFRSMPVNNLIFTKTDETATFGAAYSLAGLNGLPLSYLTTGQHVPEDIEIASADRVIDLLVGEIPDEIRSIGQTRVASNGR